MVVILNLNALYLNILDLFNSLYQFEVTMSKGTLSRFHIISGCLFSINLASSNKKPCINSSDGSYFRYGPKTTVLMYVK